MSLLSDSRVLFAGYRMPHPLENKLLIKIKTRPLTDPITVLSDSIDNLQREFKSLSESFKREINQKQINSINMGLM